MTATTTTTSRTAGDGGVLLADALSVNAVSSGLTGVALALGGLFLDDAIGAPAIALVAVGVGLIAFAEGIIAALARPDVVRRAARWIIAADLGWVAASVVVIGGSSLTLLGDVLLGAVTLAVAGFAAAQTLGLARAGDAARLGVRRIAFGASREVAATPEEAWSLVADAAGYDEFAPGIATTTTDREVREGMQRTCVDDGGRSWSETCTLVEPGRTYRMEVDTDTYPLRHRLLLDRFGMTWEITPTSHGTLLDLTFSGGVKLGVIGRLAVAAVTRTRPHERILDAYAARLRGSTSSFATNPL